MYYPDERDISGHFDAATRSAVVEFQKNMKLSPDGIVGELTWAALDAAARGRAISDTDESRLLTKSSEARDLYAARQYNGSLAILKELYADPQLASKPLYLARIIWGIASCLHQLAFAEGVSEEQRQLKLNEAISWYQEYGLRDGLDTTKKMNAAIRVRECRLAQQPTAYSELEEWKQEMN